MPTADVILLAQQVLVNSVTSNPSFIEVFTGFKVPQVPTTVGGFYVVVIIGNVVAPVAMDIEFWGNWQKGSALWKGHMQVQEAPSSVADPTVFAAVGVPEIAISEASDITVLVKFDGAEVKRRVIPVTTTATLATATDS